MCRMGKTQCNSEKKNCSMTVIFSNTLINDMNSWQFTDLMFHNETAKTEFYGKLIQYYNQYTIQIMTM